VATNKDDNRFVLQPKVTLADSAKNTLPTVTQPTSLAANGALGAAQGHIDYVSGKPTTTKKSSGGGGGSKAAPVNPWDAKMNAAQSAYDQAAGAMPGAYESTWQGQIDSLLNGILNREKFNYNMDADPMYQQVRNNYVTQGRNAMRDTMGQAAALTGGYGSSYGQTAGQQAYQGHLQQLAGTVQPQLYNLALSAYNAENEAANNRLNALQQQENAAYGRYQDAYDRAAQERAYRYNVLQDLINRQQSWKG